MDSEVNQFLQQLSIPVRQEISVAGHLLRPGSKVLLHPQPGGDILDMILAECAAVIERVEEDDRGILRVVVKLEDDPGRDLADTRHPSHRFFFGLDEIEPLSGNRKLSPSKRVLVAGIGNVFFGDDGFGPAVAKRLSGLVLAEEIEIVDFGIRGLDLAYALGHPYDAAILVDTIPGEFPGRLRIIEPDMVGVDEAAPFDSHHMDPLTVISLACRTGVSLPQIFIVGCEADLMGESMSMELSVPVAAAVDEAAEMVLELSERLLAGCRPHLDEGVGK